MGRLPAEKLKWRYNMYNMRFRNNGDNLAIEAAFVAGLELEGVRVEHLGGGVYDCYGLSEEHREFIEQHYQFWAL